MTLKELAHFVQQNLQTRADCAVRRSHVHELLAAAFGHGSWAAFMSVSVLADSGVGSAPTGQASGLVGRALQLGYPHPIAAKIAAVVQAVVSECGLTAVSWEDLRAELLPEASIDNIADLHTDDDWEGDDADGVDDEGSWDVAAVPSQLRTPLLASPLLINGLNKAAGAGNAHVHYLLAALYRCTRPNSYLYEESLKGRILTASERTWVEDYLRLEPQYRRYEAHLKAAALGGVRAAALEYGQAFDAPLFIDMVDEMTGVVDAMEMARVARTVESRARWLRIAAQEGSPAALNALSESGDAWAEDQMAAFADSRWLRLAAERAIDAGDAIRAWT